jgi:hypothetical protein
MITLDTPWIFRTVGGPLALLTLLRRHHPGVSLAYPTVQMWHSRGRISAAWQAATVYALTREGHDLDTLFTADDATMFAVPPEAPSYACAGR